MMSQLFDFQNKIKWKGMEFHILINWFIQINIPFAAS